jgi:hypothetical protein
MTYTYVVATSVDGEDIRETRHGDVHEAYSDAMSEILDIVLDTSERPREIAGEYDLMRLWSFPEHGIVVTFFRT